MFSGIEGCIADSAARTDWFTNDENLTKAAADKQRWAVIRQAREELRLMGLLVEACKTGPWSPMMYLKHLPLCTRSPAQRPAKPSRLAQRAQHRRRGSE